MPSSLILYALSLYSDVVVSNGIRLESFRMRRENTRWILCVLGGLLATTSARADDWPQWLGPKRDGVWRETGIVEKFPDGGPKVRWKTQIGAGYSGPAVAEGRVFVTDRLVAPKSSNPANPFERGKIPGTERILCLNEADGRMLWKHEYDCSYDVSYPAGPRATPTVDI